MTTTELEATVLGFTLIHSGPWQILKAWGGIGRGTLQAFRRFLRESVDAAHAPCLAVDFGAWSTGDAVSLSTLSCAIRMLRSRYPQAQIRIINADRELQRFCDAMEFGSRYNVQLGSIA